MWPSHVLQESRVLNVASKNIMQAMCIILNFLVAALGEKKVKLGSSHHGAAETNPTRNHEVVGLIPGLNQWLKDLALL